MVNLKQKETIIPSTQLTEFSSVKSLALASVKAGNLNTRKLAEMAPGANLMEAAGDLAAQHRVLVFALQVLEMNLPKSQRELCARMMRNLTATSTTKAYRAILSHIEYA
ncbi:hypothetical protein SS50377_25127 [Spironucleus salmonicida]|nr:hypothetical protein SS50377_25125 [Spironucleus salmonicida]KAH0573010.1 hypothetical protein SS50377_25127 [Spironucleus salmonicida]